MMNLKHLMSIAALASTTVLAACGATTSEDGDASDATSDTSTAADTTTAGDTTTTGDTTSKVTYKSIVIWDKSKDPAKDSTGKCGASPGTDLDAVGLYRGGVLIAVGKPGTTVYTAPATAPECPAGEGKNLAASAAGPLDGHVYASKPDTGYISLAGGSLEIQFGACAAGKKITECDGTGALTDVESGDEIDIWEVDTSYKAAASTPAAGNAYDGCVCYSDEYQVGLRPTVGSETGAAYVPASATEYNKGSQVVKVP